MNLVCPPGLASASADAAAESYAAWARGTTEYWASVVERQAGPLEVGADVLTWWRELLSQTRPEWVTRNKVVAEWPVALLRDFSAPGASGVPVLFLPPQAGHSSCIVDFGPGQSQIQAAKAAGLEGVFSLDWKAATAATRNASIADYLTVVAQAVEHAGGLVNLVGDCQGGWLAVIYAALHPETVNTLTVAGAPIDFHVGEPLIRDWMTVLSPGRDLAFYRGLVAANGGVMPGSYLLGGFIAMQPQAEVHRQLQLLVNQRDREHVDRYRRFETWFKHTQPLPGAFYLWIVEHLFQNNELVNGQLVVDGRTVDLAAITCPLYLLAGDADHITPPDQVFALKGYAGTSPAEIDEYLAPGGHLGLFMGHDALRTEWTPLLKRIANSS